MNNLNKSNSRRIIWITLAVMIGVLAGLTTISFAGNDAISAAMEAINDFKSFFILGSTGLLAIALGIAHLMKTVSSGNPQKIDFANKLTWCAIIGWALVNGTGLIASTIAKYLD